MACRRLANIWGSTRGSVHTQISPGGRLNFNLLRSKWLPGFESDTGFDLEAMDLTSLRQVGMFVLFPVLTWKGALPSILASYIRQNSWQDNHFPFFRKVSIQTKKSNKIVWWKLWSMVSWWNSIEFPGLMNVLKEFFLILPSLVLTEIGHIVTKIIFSHSGLFLASEIDFENAQF